MLEFLEVLSENAFEIATCGLIVLCNIFGKPKTAEKIKEAREKKYKKLEKKREEIAEKTLLKTNKMKATMDTLEKEINKNA